MTTEGADDRKRRLAEIDVRYDAELAELELRRKDGIVAAAGLGEGELVNLFLEQLAQAKTELNKRRQREKEALSGDP